MNFQTRKNSVLNNGTVVKPHSLSDNKWQFVSIIMQAYNKRFFIIT